jgi:hypothetical protein
MYRLHAMGFVCLLGWSVAGSAQPPDTPVTTIPYPQPIYRMNDIGKSLKLTPEQTTKLNTITTATQDRFRADYEKAGKLSDAERFTRMQDLNRQYSADWSKGARDVLNEDQRNRYQQLNYQYGGFNSLYDPDVQKRLNLTPEQVKNLREQSTWSDQQLQEINRVGGTDATKGGRLYRDYWTTRQERFNKFLTPDQLKTWNQMTGDPYTFQPSFTSGR